MTYQKHLNTAEKYRFPLLQSVEITNFTGLRTVRLGCFCDFVRSINGAGPVLDLPL